MDLDEAKKEIRENLDKGSNCPCCGQFAKMYKRKLNSAMVVALALIAKYFDENPSANWVHVENYLKGLEIDAAIRGDFPKLRHWGLIEAKSGIRADGSKRVGLYRITDLGKSFVEGNTSVISKVHLYNQEVLGFSGKKITFNMALGNRFNYAELMAS